VRITLTVPKTALAGVTLESSFARSKAATAAFSEERAFRCFGCWDFVAMVGSYEKAVRRVGCEEEPEPQQRWVTILSWHASCKQTGHFMKKMIFAVKSLEEPMRSADHPNSLFALVRNVLEKSSNH